MAYKSFEDLEVWKRACRLFSLPLPLGEGWGEGKGVITKTSASNRAEGAERNSGPDFIRFLKTENRKPKTENRKPKTENKRFTAKLRTQIYIAERIGVLENSQPEELVAKLKAFSAMFHKLVKSIKANFK